MTTEKTDKTRKRRFLQGWDWINYWPNFLEGMNYTQVTGSEVYSPCHAFNKLVSCET